MKHILLSFLISASACLPALSCKAQDKKSETILSGNIVMIDSASTLMIPLHRNATAFSNKMDYWHEFYANIIFYNFKTDKWKKLFDKDTYIVSLNQNHYNYYYSTPPDEHNIPATKDYILYRVYNVDRNQNRKIDMRDPAILYVSDKHGNNLKTLTSENENVVSVILFAKQNFAMVKIQRDTDGNGHFTDEDTNHYFVRLDLATLTLGAPVEIDNNAVGDRSTSNH